MPARRPDSWVARYAEIFDRALAAEKGLKLNYKDHGEAIRERKNFNGVRAQLRKDSMKIYPEGHPQYGTSPYDDLTLSIPEKESYILIYRLSPVEVLIEEL